METTLNRPNILIYMPDQEQAQVTLPEHPCKTPNLDRIARQGVRFTSAYPPMAHCCPARASFMTGLYPSQHGVFNNVMNDQAIRTGIKPGVEMFSEKLAASGYNLYYSGKWHVSAHESPRDRGWNEVYVKEGQLDNGSRRHKFRSTPDPGENRPRGNGEIVRPGWPTYRLYGTTDTPYEKLEDCKIVRKSIQQLDELKDSQQPWCMFISTAAPHDPFIIPEKYAKMYDPDEIELPPNYEDDLADKPGIYRRMKQVFSQLTEREVRESIAHYWGFCTMVDDFFGEMVDALERNGQLDNTIIVYVSDHGEHAGAHGLYCKGISHFDEGYRVPLVISSGKHVANPGRRIDEFVTLMDVAPTLLELSGAEPLGKCSGASLAPFLRDETPSQWRDSLYTQCNGTELYYTSRMVRTKKYKFVYNPIDMDELYDLEKDPHEMVNLAGKPEWEQVLKDMYVKMWNNAHQSEDNNFTRYIPVTTARYGPLVANGSGL